MTDLRHLANEHWRDTYRLLVDTCGGVWREFGAVDAFCSQQVNFTFVNGCLALNASQPQDLSAAIEWLNGLGLNYRVRIDLAEASSAVLAVGPALGLEGDETWRMPALVLPHIPAAPAMPVGVTTRRVDAALARELGARLAEIDSPHGPFLATLAAPSVGNDRLAIFVADLDGRFAATSAVVRTGDTCGIYAVGTAEWARRRGVGTAVTWATLEYARTQWGCTAAVLQSSPVGVLVYEKMGFQVVAGYQLFDPPSRRP